jgi:hypothetical protein
MLRRNAFTVLRVAGRGTPEEGKKTAMSDTCAPFIGTSKMGLSRRVKFFAGILFMICSIDSGLSGERQAQSCGGVAE